MISSDIMQWSTLATLAKVIDYSKPLFTDFETYNDSKHYKGKLYGKVRIAQFMQEGWDKVVFIELKFGKDANNIKGLRDIINNAVVVGQNFAYDYATAQEHDDNIYRRVNIDKYRDILLYARELYPLLNNENFSGRYSLDLIYSGVLGFDPYKDCSINKKALQKAKWGLTLTDEMLLYAGLDVWYMPLLWQTMMLQEKAQLALYTPEQVEAYHLRLENAHLAVDIGLKMQSVGLFLDEEESLNYIQKYQNQSANAYSVLGELPADFNIRSPKQVSDYLGTLSSDKVTLSFLAYRDNHPKTKALLEARQSSSRIATIQKYAELSRDNGRVTGHFSPTTTTGRFSSSQENMQNQPRDSKTVFKAPRGEIMIGFDYAQIELRTMCALTGDERMYKTFKEFGDIHTNTQEMCGISIRNIAKQVNFGNLYGMGISKFQEVLVVDGIYMEEQELKFIRDRFLSTYARIPEYHKQSVRNSRGGVPNYSILGHPYFSQYYNQMNNMANQASGTSEVAKMFFRYANELGLIDSNTSNLAVQIHDSNLFYYAGTDNLAEHYAFAIGILAQKAWFKALEIGVSIGTAKYKDIPMPVEVGISTHWKSVDDNIIVNLKGLEYYDNPDYYDSWLEEFKVLHKTNTRKDLR